jgi:multidrug efflux pump subunit AcrB
VSAPGEKSLTSRIIEVFLKGNLTPLVMMIALLAGVAALYVTPREEEPQIVVPLADVYVEVPGASAREVERLVSTRLEKLLYQIDGVEYVYSTSRPHQAIVTVRFFVGENREDSLVKIHNKLQTNLDQIPPQVASWVVKPVEIDDVPILAVTLWSKSLDDYVLRRAAEELEIRVQGVPGTGRTSIQGGRPRKLRVLVDPDALESHGVPLEHLLQALRASSVALPAGSLVREGREVVLEASRALRDRHEVEDLVVEARDGHPVYVRDVARVVDGPDEPRAYVRYGRGAGAKEPAAGRDYAAVTLAVAKKKGENAVWVARAVRERIEKVRRDVLPDGVELTITRDYGVTANAKVNELVEGLLVAIVMVTILLAMTLGWREALIVALAVPLAFSLTLLINFLTGYTINRVTLFALILALGLVVDDPIVDVENIFRHLRMGRQKPRDAVLTAVNEVRPPIILATLAVIISFLPMFFITGMMGPYMRPMALNVPLAMLMSLAVAFTVTPWLAYHFLKRHEFGPETAVPLERTKLYRGYAAVLKPFLASRSARWGLLLVTAGLFAGSAWLALDRRVPLKMLPYDNKNELQVVIDLPEGTPLEMTEATASEMAATLRGMAEVTGVTSYVGEPSPMDFNGLVRHYYMRRAPNLADLRVNLLSKKEREQQSHQIALRVRAALAKIARRDDAVLKVVEYPPGPPVIATITVEVYAGEGASPEVLQKGALAVAARLGREPGVYDVDTTVEAPAPKLRYVLDREKAALHGITGAQAARALRTLVDGAQVGTLSSAREVQPLVIEVRLPRGLRTSQGDLERLTLTGSDGQPVALAEIGSFEKGTVEGPIYHKNLRRVAYVFAEVAGRAPAEVIYDVRADLAGTGGDHPLPVKARSYLHNGGGIPWALPDGIDLDWSGEGEWKVTVDAFRDLGIAFAVACLGIYILLVHETRSYLMPLILMISIPLTVIGIVPGFWLLNALVDRPVAGVDNPIFFTATAMIGMIALAGIAVRNAILLIEFVRKAQEEGLGLEDALLQSGAVRFRPIFLTAGTAMLAAVPITLDPIFSGLAWALIFGLLVSTAFTLVVVPVVYAMVYGKRAARGETAGD